MRIEIIIILALIQGITEFLPISSSGHLILLPSLSGIDDQGLAMDVAVHLGSLIAVVSYFRRDVAMLIGGTFELVRLRWTFAARLASYIALATIPVLVAGLLLKLAGLTEGLRSIKVIGWATIVFGILLYVSDKFFLSNKKLQEIRLFHMMCIGLAQMLALIPGTSRSGITMTAARFFQYERTESARISMLMSIPTILAAGALLGLDVMDAHAQGNMLIRWQDLLIGAVLSGIAAYGALFFMMRWLEKASMTPFVIYRMVLGTILLSIVYL